MESVTVPVPQPAELAAPPASLPLEFRASGGEYFRIWIVNLLLTLLTLGLYSPWAKVRRLRYLYGSTSLAGSAFEYHGQPLQILKGRLIAAAALAIYLAATTIWPLSVFVFLPIAALVVPWMLVLSRRFHLRMSSWRNIRFGFHGTYRGALGVFVGWPLAVALTAYLLMPFWLQSRARFLLGNTSFGTRRFEFDKPASAFARFFYIVYGTIVGALAVLVLLAVVLGGIVAASPPSMAVVAAIGVAALLFVPLAIAAYYERSFTNACFDGLRIGPHVLHCRLQTGRLLFLYVTNVLGVLLTLGLAYPWALVRRMRYQLECMHLVPGESIDAFVAGTAPAASATGQEVGDFFAMDFGL